MGLQDSFNLDSLKSKVCGVVGGLTGKVSKKACCVCKETKQKRDDCIARNGVDKCREAIEAHNQCLRNAGFTVEDK